MSKGKRIFLTVVGVVAVVAAIVLVSKLTGGDKNFSEKYEGTNLETSGEFEREDTYAAYLKEHEGRELADFYVGLKVRGKLVPKRIRGGVLLVETDYEMR